MQHYRNFVKLDKLRNAYFVTKFHFDVAENERARNLRNLAKNYQLYKKKCEFRESVSSAGRRAPSSGGRAGRCWAGEHVVVRARELSRYLEEV